MCDGRDGATTDGRTHDHFFPLFVSAKKTRVILTFFGHVKKHMKSVSPSVRQSVSDDQAERSDRRYDRGKERKATPDPKRVPCVWCREPS